MAGFWQGFVFGLLVGMPWPIEDTFTGAEVSAIDGQLDELMADLEAACMDCRGGPDVFDPAASARP